jgi:hypothetical protein
MSRRFRLVKVSEADRAAGEKAPAIRTDEILEADDAECAVEVLRRRLGHLYAVNPVSPNMAVGWGVSSAYVLVLEPEEGLS